eukprot:1087863-Prymnesium_polylepis.1
MWAAPGERHGAWCLCGALIACATKENWRGWLLRCSAEPMCVCVLTGYEDEARECVCVNGLRGRGTRTWHPRETRERRVCCGSTGRRTRK